MNLKIETTTGEAKTLVQIEEEFLATGKPVPPGVAQQASVEREAVRRRAEETEDAGDS